MSRDVDSRQSLSVPQIITVVLTSNARLWLFSIAGEHPTTGKIFNICCKLDSARIVRLLPALPAYCGYSESLNLEVHIVSLEATT
jgi:hypothetical protein